MVTQKSLLRWGRETPVGSTRSVTTVLHLGEASVRVKPKDEIMGNTHRIDIEPIGLGQRGQLYLVSYGGAVLVERSRNPEFDACRALLEQGATGRLEVWRRGTTCPALRLDIETGARLTV